MGVKMERENQIEFERDLIEIFDEEYEKRYLITPTNTAEKLTEKGYLKETQGEWITDEYFETIYCSLCNGLAPVDCEKERFYQSNYCPECGAHMKGAE